MPKIRTYLKALLSDYQYIENRNCIAKDANISICESLEVSPVPQIMDF